MQDPEPLPLCDYVASESTKLLRVIEEKKGKQCIASEERALKLSLTMRSE